LTSVPTSLPKMSKPSSLSTNTFLMCGAFARRRARLAGDPATAAANRANGARDA
jgi:hypothetical protein